MPGFDFDPSDIAERYDRGRTSILKRSVIGWRRSPVTFQALGSLHSRAWMLDWPRHGSTCAPVPLDLFEKMLAVAAHSLVDSGVAQVRGAAEALLFSDRSFDVVFVSMVLHYIRWPRRHRRSSAGD
jgi:hypothetical protein